MGNCNANHTLVCFVAAIGLSAAGCGTRPLRLRIDSNVERPDKSVVLFFVDGMDRARLEDLLKKGRLPTIQRRFVDGGVRVENGVTGMPAMTYPNTVSLLTGRFPGHHGIVGNQWFDRRTLASTDYIRPTLYQTDNFDFHYFTIYEMLPDLFTISVQGHTHRGATIAHTNEIATGLAWSVGRFMNIDQLAAGSLEEVAEYANRVGRWPSLLTFYFPGIDEIGHRNGSDSHAYAEALENIDHQIKRVTDAMDKCGLADRTTFVLISDHGHVPVHSKKTFDLVNWLRAERGLCVHHHVHFAKDYPSAFEYYQNVDAVVIDGSFRRAYIHLKGPKGWSHPVEPQDIEAVLTGRSSAVAEKNGDAAGSKLRSGETSMWDLPCVELICTSPSRGAVRIMSHRGTATIERRIDGSTTAYRLVTDADHPGQRSAVADDPLGLADDPKLLAFSRSGWHTSREWLAASAASRHPDFVPQIAELFDSPRSGEIVVFTADDWVFAGRDRGEHGSCLPEDMLIPMYFAGPGLPKGATIPHARIVDMVPTILDLLGEGDRISRHNMDGESLAPQLRSAGATQASSLKSDPWLKGPQASSP